MSACVSRREVAAARRRRLFFEPLEERSLLAAVITVNSTLDTDVRDSEVTLREAIRINNRALLVSSLTAAEQAQVVGTPTSSDRDTIGFNIPGSGVRTISRSAFLPNIVDPVVIDGYTQPGAAPNTDPNGFNGTLLIEFRALPGIVALGIGASDSVVRGLIINGASQSAGISIVGGSNIVVEGNFIGTDATGTTSVPNQYGIDISATSPVTATGHRIGGSQAAARNIISGNIQGGIRFAGSGTLTSTVVQGNFIGTN